MSTLSAVLALVFGANSLLFGYFWGYRNGLRMAP